MPRAMIVRMKKAASSAATKMTGMIEGRTTTLCFLPELLLSTSRPSASSVTRSSEPYAAVLCGAAG